MGHNSYGECAWPNDIIYVFPIVGFSLSMSLSMIIILTAQYILIQLRVFYNSLVSPYVIKPEWYLLNEFLMLRMILDQCIALMSLILISIVIASIVVVLNIEKCQNILRRSISYTLSIVSNSFVLGLIF